MHVNERQCLNDYPFTRKYFFPHFIISIACPGGTWCPLAPVVIIDMVSLATLAKGSFSAQTCSLF